MQLSRIYTKTGDKGQTALVGGDLVSKSDLRLETYGTVDELNAHVGMLRTLAERVNTEWSQELFTQLKAIQNKLFDVGSDLATLPESPYKNKALIQEEDLTQLEQWLDAMNEHLPNLRSFTLPGGGELNAWAHLARTVCRRAEREVCRLDEVCKGNNDALRYLNRLSDYLFVVSRYVSLKNNEPEYLWERPLQNLNKK
jgi:cob(I)alamin adenosyltransferase